MRGNFYTGALNFNGALAATVSRVAADQSGGDRLNGLNTDGTRALKIDHGTAPGIVTEDLLIRSGPRPAGAGSMNIVVGFEMIDDQGDVQLTNTGSLIHVKNLYRGIKPLLNFGVGTNHNGPYLVNSSNNGVGVSQVAPSSPITHLRTLTANGQRGQWEIIVVGASTAVNGPGKEVFPACDEFAAVLYLAFGLNCTTDSIIRFDVGFYWGEGRE